MIQQQVEFFAAWMQTKFGVELFGDEKEGQGLVEYALILVLIAIVVIVILGLLGGSLPSIASNIMSTLSNAL